jgi:hypothetical protein
VKAIEKENERLAGLGNEARRKAGIPGLEMEALVDGWLGINRESGFGPPPNQANEGLREAVDTVRQSLPLAQGVGSLSASEWGCPRKCRFMDKTHIKPL